MLSLKIYLHPNAFACYKLTHGDNSFFRLYMSRGRLHGSINGLSASILFNKSIQDTRVSHKNTISHRVDYEEIALVLISLDSKLC